MLLRGRHVAISGSRLLWPHLPHSLTASLVGRSHLRRRRLASAWWSLRVLSWRATVDRAWTAAPASAFGVRLHSILQSYSRSRRSTGFTNSTTWHKLEDFCLPNGNAPGALRALVVSSILTSHSRLASPTITWASVRITVDSVVRTKRWVLRQPIAFKGVALHSLQTLYRQCSTSVVRPLWQRLAFVREHSLQRNVGWVWPPTLRALLPSGIPC